MRTGYANAVFINTLKAHYYVVQHDVIRWRLNICRNFFHGIIIDLFSVMRPLFITTLYHERTQDKRAILDFLIICLWLYFGIFTSF